MSIRCRVFGHKESCFQVKAGWPWEFHMHCLRCGLMWREDRYLRPADDRIMQVRTI